MPTKRWVKGRMLLSIFCLQIRILQLISPFVYYFQGRWSKYVIAGLLYIYCMYICLIQALLLGIFLFSFSSSFSFFVSQCKFAGRPSSSQFKCVFLYQTFFYLFFFQLNLKIIFPKRGFPPFARYACTRLFGRTI